MTVINTERRPERTKSVTPLPSFALVEGAANVSAERLKEPEGLALQPGKLMALEVISGVAKGRRYEFTKPRVILGRMGGGADFEIDDSEVSRWHCAIEVKPDSVWLRDLESTNGTYFDEDRTRAAFLMDGAQFRIGNTILEMKISPRPK